MTLFLYRAMEETSSQIMVAFYHVKRSMCHDSGSS